jgi:hypothetical protein
MELKAADYPRFHGVFISARAKITSEGDSSKFNDRSQMPCIPGLAAPQHLKYRTALY